VVVVLVTVIHPVVLEVPQVQVVEVLEGHILPVAQAKMVHQIQVEEVALGGFQKAVRQMDMEVLESL
jgi:hypothetical protein|tara:strand:- start:1230 stop:1430 length:201 start_codon:yes stop_codon:yes gene_type:complete